MSNTLTLKDGLLSITKAETLASMEYHATLEIENKLAETYSYFADKYPAVASVLDLENGHHLADCVLAREMLSGMRYAAAVLSIVAELRADKSFETTILSIPSCALADASQYAAGTLTPQESHKITNDAIDEYPGFYRAFFEEVFTRCNARKLSMNVFAGVVVALNSFVVAAEAK